MPHVDVGLGIKVKLFLVDAAINLGRMSSDLIQGQNPYLRLLWPLLVEQGG